MTAIGLGSAFGDDRVGRRAAELLSRRLARVLPLRPPGASLPEALDGRAQAVLVDTLRRDRMFDVLSPRRASYLVSIGPPDTGHRDARPAQGVEAAAVRLARELDQELTHR